MTSLPLLSRSGARVALVAALVALAASGVRAQTFTWNSYTSLAAVRAVVPEPDGRAWCATGGGAFHVTLANDSVDVYRNIGALSAISLSGVAFDAASGYAAFGGSSGELDVRAPDGTWRHSLDIKLNEQRRTINQLQFVNGLLYIAADYGVSTFDPARFAFIATARHLGAIPAETRAFSIAQFGQNVLVGTEQGIAYVPVSAPNIADSAFWLTIAPALLPNPNVTALAATTTYAYIGTGAGIRAWDGTNVVALTGPAGSDASPFVSIAVSGSLVYAATATTLYAIDGLSSSAVALDHPSPLTAVAISDSGDVLVGTNANGLLALTPTGSVRTFSVNSPAGNVFSDLTVDRNGLLWAATSYGGGTGSGIARFDGTTWTNFTTSSNPVLPTNDIVSIAVDSSGSVWGGTFGAGLLRMRPAEGGYDVHLFDTSNSPLSGVINNAAYIVINGLSVDRNNILWMVPYRGESGPIKPQLAAYDINRDAWYAMSDPLVDFRQCFGIAIDLSGTKWMAPVPSYRGTAQNPVGLMYFNEGSSLDNAGGRVWGTVGTPQGLRTNSASAVAIDNDGELWVGTTSGINIIGNPESAAQGNPLSIRKPFLSVLNGDNMNVNTIMVDPLNNKWLGTVSNGVFVVNADGSALLAHFDAETTPLLDDEILSITEDRRNGIVYIGTKNGLSSVTSSGLHAGVLSTLRIGPQPYRIPSSGMLQISGIGPDAEVRIFTAAGSLVRTYTAGTLTDVAGSNGWDGRDQLGSLVNTGVYLIVAGQPDGSSQVAKCAVVRE